MSDAQSTGSLGPEELAEHEILDLPNREAMSLIQPGLGLIEGNIVQPPDSSGTPGILQPPSQQPADPAPAPAPTDEATIMPVPDTTQPQPPVAETQPAPSQPYEPAQTATTSS